MKTERKSNVLAAFEFLTAVGIILFWIGFFTVGLAPANAPACYFAYEHSFPPADLVLAVILISAAILLLRGRPAGRSFSLVAAGGLIFLGIIDASFNLQNGVYALSALDLVLNAFINIWCVGFGAFLVARFVPRP